MLYRWNLAKLTLRELRDRHETWQLPLVLALRAFRIMPSEEIVSDSVAPYRVDWEEIPEEIRGKIAPYLNQMLDCGFCDPSFAWFSNPYSSSQICNITFRHSSRAHRGSISLTLVGPARARKEIFGVSVTAAYTDGSYFITTNRKRILTDVPFVEYQRILDATVTEIFESHCRSLRAASAGKKIIPVDSREAAEAIDDDFQRRWCEFHANRGVLTQCEESRQKAIESVMNVPGAEEDKKFAAVYQEIGRIAEGKSSVAGGLVLFFLTAVAFMAVGAKDFHFGFLLLIVGVLLFHECGHFLAMRIFGYRNLRMFFIPFFGAAVFGKNFNVPG